MKGKPKHKRCIALDGNGRQCRAASVGEYSYHGEHELYDSSDPNGVSWVLAPFCFRHYKRDETHKEAMRRMRKQHAVIDRQENNRRRK